MRERRDAQNQERQKQETSRPHQAPNVVHSLAHTLNLEDQGILPESLTTPTAKCDEKMCEARFDLLESLQFAAAEKEAEWRFHV